MFLGTLIIGDYFINVFLLVSYFIASFLLTQFVSETGKYLFLELSK